MANPNRLIILGIGSGGSGSTASSSPQPPVSADSTDPPPARPPSLLSPSERGEQALTVVARREFQAGRHAAALSGLDTLLQIEPDDVSAVDALFLKAEVFRELNRLPDERAAYSEILRRFPENPRSVEAQFPRVPLPNTPSGRSGACTGKPTNSNWRLRLTELGTRFPQTQWDAWWAAGELLEEKIKDNARARKAYSKVPESSRNYQRAQRKLSRLRP